MPYAVALHFIQGSVRGHGDGEGWGMSEPRCRTASLKRAAGIALYYRRPKRGFGGGGGGLAQGHGVGLFASAYWPLALAHSDPLWAQTCVGRVNGAPG